MPSTPRWPRQRLHAAIDDAKVRGRGDEVVAPSAHRLDDGAWLQVGRARLDDFADRAALERWPI